MIKNDLTVVVSSCDRYQDILRPFSVCFRKFWEDCPSGVMLATETTPPDMEDTVFNRIVPAGAGTSWCERLYACLEQAKTPYILLVLDDFFLKAPVSNQRIEALLETAKEMHAAHLRLEPLPKPQRRITGEVGEYVKGQAYRVSAQIAIWDRAYLMRMLKEIGKSELWYFERQGSFISEKYDQISLGCYQTVMPFEEIICAARWLPGGIKFCQKENIPIQREIRADEPASFTMYRNLRGIIFHICPTLITKIKLKMTANQTNGR